METVRKSTRCILLFARPAGEEARAKRLARARGVFALARRRVVAAVAALPGVDLLVVGPGGALPQRGGGFAERLANAFADARRPRLRGDRRRPHGRAAAGRPAARRGVPAAGGDGRRPRAVARRRRLPDRLPDDSRLPLRRCPLADLPAPSPICPAMQRTPAPPRSWIPWRTSTAAPTCSPWMPAATASWRPSSRPLLPGGRRTSSRAAPAPLADPLASRPPPPPLLPAPPTP